MKKIIIIACGLIAMQTCFGADKSWDGNPSKLFDSALLKTYYNLLELKNEHGFKETPPQPPQLREFAHFEGYLHGKHLEEEDAYKYKKECNLYLGRLYMNLPPRPEPIFSTPHNGYGELCTPAEIAYAKRKEEEAKQIWGQIIKTHQVVNPGSALLKSLYFGKVNFILPK